MNLAPMRYKDYVWPHNPETYTISFKRQVAVAKVPFGRYGMQDLGMSYRVMEGEGVFAGKGAYDEFKKLASVFYQGGPGLLIHPVWQASQAYFVLLELAQQPLENYVRYRFAFWETVSYTHLDVYKRQTAYRAYYQDHCQIKTRVYDGLLNMLSELKAKGIKLAVVSNKPDKMCIRDRCSPRDARSRRFPRTRRSSCGRTS